MNKKIFDFFKKYKHAVVLLYTPFYMLWFNYLEKNITKNYYIIHSRFDDMIPFNEYFIIPYLLWFLYIAIAVTYFLFKDRIEFLKYFSMLAIGMSICLLICYIFPNGTDFRPAINPNKNWESLIVSRLYSIDTNTNVFPSIHVYNSIVTYIAINKSKYFVKNHIVKIFSLILTFSICLSTIFLKQHSIIDMIGGAFLSYIMYNLIYINIPVSDYKDEKELARERSL